MTHVDIAAAQAHRNPTPAQKEAGNYAKGHAKVHGLDVTIENAKGSFRRGEDADGNPWKVKMPSHYGYLKRTEGADGDHVDAYIGPHLKSPKVFIVNQNDAETGKFDEHKTFLGFSSKRQVIRAYMDAFSDGKASDRLGSIAEMDIPKFKEWLKSDTSKPHKFAGGGGVKDDGPWNDFAASKTDEDGPWTQYRGTQPKPDVGQGTAALEGYLSGASGNFRDEVYGASEASGLPKVLGGFRAPIGAARLAHENLFPHPAPTTEPNAEGKIPSPENEAVTPVYQKARDEVRARQKTAQEQYPWTYGASDVAGALVSPAGRIVGPAAAEASLARRAGNLAGMGASYGAISGAGAGEGAQDTLLKSGIGAGAGALAGPVTLPLEKVIGAIWNAASHVAKPWTEPWLAAVRGMRSVDDEAVRAILNSMPKEMQEQAPGVLSKAQAAGIPLVVGDVGGQGTLDLALTSGNVSSEALGTMKKFVNERFDGQFDRYKSFLQNLVGGRLDSFTRKADIRDASKIANPPAYKAAYEAGDKPIWSPELERLSSSPTVLGAMRGAENRWKDFQINDGFGAMSPPARIDNGGILSFEGKGLKTYPNIQYWDYTARNLAALAQKAKNSGDLTDAMLYGGLEKKVKAELDRLVPEFGEARAGAARFFGESSAVDAGTKFTTKKMPVPEAQKAFAKFTDEQKAEFTQAYFAKRVDDLGRVGNNQNLANKITPNPEIAAKDRFVLGEEGTKQLQNYVAVEKGMDRLRTTFGNSTTARQRQMLKDSLAMGLAASGTADSNFHVTGYGPLEIGAAAMFGGRRWVNKQVANRVAEMLVSNDPAIFAKGVKEVGSNPNLTRAFNMLGARQAIPLPLTQQSQRAIPNMQGTVASHAEDNQP